MLYLTEGGRGGQVIECGGQDVGMVESTLSTQQDPSGHRYAGELDEDQDDDHLGGDNDDDHDDLVEGHPFDKYIPLCHWLRHLECIAVTVGMEGEILDTIQLILFLVSAQNDFITGSLRVDGAVGIVDPIRQLIEEEELWGQV